MELINDYIFTRLKESMEAKLEELIEAAENNRVIESI